MSNFVHVVPEIRVGGAEKLIADFVETQSDNNLIDKVLSFNSNSENHLVKKIKENSDYLELNRKNKINFIIKLVKYVMKNKNNIFLLHLQPTLIYFSLISFFFPHTKFTYIIHYERNKPNFLRYYLQRSFFMRSNVNIVAVSYSSRINFEKIYKIEDKIKVILNGIRVQPINLNSNLKKSFQRTINTKILITVSRIVPVKNLELLINSFNELSLKYDLSLVIVGKDPSISQSEIMKLKKVANDGVFFVGEQSDVNKYLSIADIYCLCSISEALPISVLEAMGKGLLVVTTNVGDLSRIVIDNENGFLSDSFEEEEYKKKLQQAIMLDDVSLKQFKNRNKEKITNYYSISHMITSYKKIWI